MAIYYVLTCHKPGCQEEIEEYIYPPYDAVSFRHAGLFKPPEPVYKIDDIAKQGHATCHNDSDGNHLLDGTVVEVFSTWKNDEISIIDWHLMLKQQKVKINLDS